MDIFVFGSNLAGRHGAGAALCAFCKHGAIYGQGGGIQGNSYGIPTKDGRLNTLDLHLIEQHVWEFFRFAHSHPEMTFNVTPIGCGLAGYTPYEIAPMFAMCLKLPNIKLPISFLEELEKRGSHSDDSDDIEE